MDPVSIIIPARNAEATLAATLESVTAQDYPGEVEVVVVDDGSTDSTKELVRAFSAAALVAGHGEGPGPARNLGAAVASHSVLAFTDADCRPERGWISAGLRRLEKAELVQGTVVPDPEQPIGPWDRTVWVDRESGLYETANLFVRRSLFDDLGGFVDFLGPVVGKPLAEDVWFGWRAKRAGAEVAFAPEAVVRHEVFRRGPGGFVAERVRTAYFPAIVRRVPELRRTFLHARFFLSRRSMLFDAVVLSLVLALVHPVFLLGALAYLFDNLRDASRKGRRAPAVALVAVAADVVTFASLAWGTARYRCFVL